MTNKTHTLSGAPENHLAVFQETAIRRTWHNEARWFSVVDVCGVLTLSPDAGAYWRKLKQRLGAEGSEVVTFCHGLKLVVPDGKQPMADSAYTVRGELVEPPMALRQAQGERKGLRMNGGLI